MISEKNKDKKRDKKIAIIQKSIKIMHLKGYNATGVQELVDAAGIPKGSFYNYFKSKEDFAIEALKYFAGRFQGIFEQNLNDKSISPIKRLDKLFNELIEWFTDEFKFKSGCFAGNLCQEMGDVNRPIGKAVENLFAGTCGLLKDCLQEAQETGEIDRSIDSGKIAEAIWNSWEGALMRMKTSKNAKPLENFKYMVFKVLLK
ncbi:MAG: TetR family transcriptional regulator C-terminal domain-containing protein [Candidatus Anammoxibacter sp.]